MADVTIDGTISTSTSRGLRSLVFTDANNGYQFYIDGDSDFKYSKTTDGGATWGAAVSVGSGTVLAFDVWYDQWTPGDSGTLIHLAWFGTTLDDVLYRSLDVSDDSLSASAVVIQAGATAAGAVGAHCSITKSRGGNLYVTWMLDAGVEFGLKKSTDGGANWSAGLTGFNEANGDWTMLFPGNAADANDIWGLFLDVSANALTLKVYDDSANSISESATIATVVENTSDLTAQYPFSGSIRHSDGHLIASVVTERDTATADHRVFDINGAGSITELTPIFSDLDDMYYPSVFIDQNTEDIYVAYNGAGVETLGTATHTRYAKSVDGGANWTFHNYSEGSASAKLQVWAPLMGPRFYMSWRVGTQLHGNAVNSVTFSSLTHHTLTADPGSFTITGTTASLERGLKVSADAGGVAVTGTNATLARGYPLSADAGAFTITGTDATFDREVKITADPGSVTVTGTAASLEVGYKVAADEGSVLITGTDATLVYTDAGDPVLTAEAGSVAITGTDASLEKGSKVSAEAGAFTTIGTAASLEADRKVSADSGSVAVTGTVAALERGLKVTAEAGSYAVTGTAASLEADRRVTAEVGAVEITGTDAALDYSAALNNIVLEAEAGAVTITGVDAEFVYTRVFRAVPGATRAQHRRFRQNAEVVLLGLPVTSGTSLEVRISGTAEGYVKDVGGVKAVAAVFGVEAAAEITLQAMGAARGAAGILSFPKHVVVRLEGMAAGFEVGEVIPQAGSSAVPVVRRRGVTRAGEVHPVGVSNPTDREIAMMALQLVRQRRKNRNSRRYR